MSFLQVKQVKPAIFLMYIGNKYSCLFLCDAYPPRFRGFLVRIAFFESYLFYLQMVYKRISDIGLCRASNFFTYL